MLTVYLLRHGETHWNADGNRYCGRTDIGLTDKGKAQAQTVQEQLKDITFDAVYSSPLERAYQTALTASGNKEVIKDERLIEADFGTWEGKTREEFVAENPQYWADWCNDPATAKAGGSGETALDVVTRIDDFFNEMQKKYPSGTILVVAHNGVNRLYMAWKLSMELKNYRRLVQENSSVTLFSLDNNGEIVLKKLNSKG